MRIIKHEKDYQAVYFCNDDPNQIGIYEKTSSSEVYVHASLVNKICKRNNITKEKNLIAKVCIVERNFSYFLGLTIGLETHPRYYTVSYNYCYEPDLKEVTRDEFESYTLPDVGVCENNKIVWRRDYV